MNDLTATMQATPIGAAAKLHSLKQLERKLLWLSSWMIHNANHIRPNRDGLKVGGHQASCASVISIMTALYFEIARPQDRIAVKPHAGPVFHAINYLFVRGDRRPARRAASTPPSWSVGTSAHLIVPLRRRHRQSDQTPLRPQLAGIGTTGRGIGPTYSDKMSRMRHPSAGPVRSRRCCIRKGRRGHSS